MVELMLTIALVGILAAVGYPAYQKSVKTGNRADAIDTLVALAGHMEEYYLNNDTYVGATTGGYAVSSDGLYNMSISSADAFTYTLTATPVGGDSQCGNLTLNSLGQKGVSAAGATVEACW